MAKQENNNKLLTYVGMNAFQDESMSFYNLQLLVIRENNILKQLNALRIEDKKSKDAHWIVKPTLDLLLNRFALKRHVIDGKITIDNLTEMGFPKPVAEDVYSRLYQDTDIRQPFQYTE
jgi:hypothetical protein